MSILVFIKNKLYDLVNILAQKSPKFIYVCQRPSTMNSIKSFVSELFPEVSYVFIESLQDFNSKINESDVILISHELYFDQLYKFQNFDNQNCTLIIDEEDMLDLYTEE